MLTRISILMLAVALFLGTPANAQPANDECVGATPIDLGVNLIDTTGATSSIDPAGSVPCAVLGALSADCWYSFTPAESGLLNITTCDAAGIDTDLVVYDGDCSTLNELACNGDSTGATGCQLYYSEVDVIVFAGVTYLIRIGEWGTASTGGLNNVTLTLSTLLPVDGLTCGELNPGAGDGMMVANWTNLDSYDSINVYIDGALADTVAGGDTSYTSGPYTTPSTVQICLEPILGATVGPQVCCDATLNLAAPPNDECAGAIEVFEGVNVADNNGATNSPDPWDPTNCGVLGAMTNDVWFTYTATDNGELNVQTCDAAGVDTDLVAYEGICGALNQIACNGDATTGLPGCQPFYSDMSFIVLAGETYTIRLGCWSGAGCAGTNNMTLTLNPIAGIPPTSLICTDQGPGTGVVDVTWQNNDTYDSINVLVNGVLETTLGGTDTAYSTVPVTPGLTLEICLEALVGGVPVPLACCTADTTAIAPSNDECFTFIEAFEGVTAVSNLGATNSPDPFDPLNCGVLGGLNNDVWFSYTALADGQLNVQTCDGTTPGIDTDLVMYAGDCGTLSQIGCSGDAAGLAGCQPFYSDMTAPITAGETYYIRLGAWADTEGVTNMTIAELAPVLNDECADAVDIPEGDTAISTQGATNSIDPYDDLTCPGTFLGVMNNDIWYTHTATETGILVVKTCDQATWDTDLVAYEGVCGAMTQIACNGDGIDPAAGVACGGFTSYMEVPVTSGEPYVIRVGSWTGGASGTGTLTLAYDLCAAVSDFAGTAECDTGDVTLGWNINGIYDSYEIYRDGTLIADPDGADSSYLDPGVAPGSYSYEIYAVCASGVSFSQTAVVNVAAYSGETDLVFGLEGFDDIDSVSAISAALTAAGLSVLVTDIAPADFGCLGSAGIQRVWVMTGTYPNDYRISVADGDALAAANIAGKGMYFEAGDHWGFAHTVSQLDTRDGVDDLAVIDGDDSFLSMDGADSTLGLDLSDQIGIPYNQANLAGSDWTDQINAAVADAAGPEAAVIWMASGGVYNTGVFYNTDSGGKFISQSWEFGGFGGDQNEIANRYIAALAGTPPPPPGGQFLRGDVNNDAGFNIADAVAMLAALFSGGASPVCSDAADANDDGGLNIADAVSILASLFSGAAPPPAPGPNVCGPDPTDDALDCAVSTCM